MTPEELIIEYENASRRNRQVGEEYEAQRTAILAIVQDQLEALAAEYAPKFDEASHAVSVAECAARDAVLATGHTAKGTSLSAVYVKPSVRTTWDTARLEGYATAHPEILAWRKQTEVAARVDFKLVK